MSEGADAVSRETPLPPVPSVARGVFPVDRLRLAEQFAALLADDGIVRGLLGPREVPRLWDRHLLNCAVLAETMPDGATIADLGSGAGLPGIVLAIARPDLTVTLVEPLQRRTVFLDEAVATLGLTNVEVVRAKAEALHGGIGFDVVTSRAVAALGVLLDWSMPLVRPDGALVAMKGGSVRDEITAAAGDLLGWRCAAPEVLTLGAGLLETPTVALRVCWGDPAAIAWPPTRQGDRGPKAAGRRATNPRSRPSSRQQRRRHDR